MRKRADEDRYFRSTSFALCEFLFAKGEQVVGVNSTADPRKKEFCFLSTDHLHELVEIYKYAHDDDIELGVSVRKIQEARSRLLDRLNDE